MAVDYGRLVLAYRNIRARRDELRKEYEAADAALVKDLSDIENFMLKDLLRTNSMRVSTAEGTFYRQKKIMPRVDDWDALYRYIRQTDAFDLLERRVGRAAVSRHMDIHSDQPPPGVSVSTEWVVGVRKPTDKVED